VRPDGIRLKRLERRDCRCSTLQKQLRLAVRHQPRVDVPVRARIDALQSLPLRVPFIDLHRQTWVDGMDARCKHRSFALR